MIRLLASAAPGEVRVLAIDAHGAIDAGIWRPGGPGWVGDLHRGRIAAKVPALAGAFVALVDGEGFLPDSAGGRGVAEGAVLGVRVARAPQGGKGLRLTALLDDAERVRIGNGPPALIAAGPNPLQVLAALHPDAPIAIDDPGLVATLPVTLGNRVSVVRDAFDDRAASAFAALSATALALPGGGVMHIHHTPAVTAIDIDLAGAAAGRRDKSAAHRDLNTLIPKEIARQVRLRAIGGAIVVDVAGMNARRRAALGPAFAASVAHDTVPTRFLGFSALGFAEILRPRLHAPVHELLAGPHAAGLDALRRLMRESLARPEVSFRVVAAPAVANALAEDSHARADLARRTGRPLILGTDRSLAAPFWRIEE